MSPSLLTRSSGGKAPDILCTRIKRVVSVTFYPAEETTGFTGNTLKRILQPSFVPRASELEMFSTGRAGGRSPDVGSRRGPSGPCREGCRLATPTRTRHLCRLPPFPNDLGSQFLPLFYRIIIKNPLPSLSFERLTPVHQMAMCSLAIICVLFWQKHCRQL